jgi:hypothetical protein
MSSPRVWTRRARSSASGASDSAWRACPAWRRNPGAAVPPAFPPGVAVHVEVLACELPLSRFSLAEIRREVLAEGIVGVFWIMDSGSGHRGQKAVARLRAQWPTTVPVHTPIPASRLLIRAASSRRLNTHWKESGDLLVAIPSRDSPLHCGQRDLPAATRRRRSFSAVAAMRTEPVC